MTKDPTRRFSIVHQIKQTKKQKSKKQTNKKFNHHTITNSTTEHGETDDKDQSRELSCFSSCFEPQTVALRAECLTYVSLMLTRDETEEISNQ